MHSLLVVWVFLVKICLSDINTCDSTNTPCNTENTSHHNEFIQEEFGRQSHSFYNAAKEYKSKNLNPLIDVTDVQSSDIILDVGCGPGLITIEIAKRNPQKIIGIDLTDEMLDIAKQHAIDNGFDINNNDKIEFIKANAEQLPFKDNTFDTVVTRWTFHHFTELTKIINEIYRVLKPKTGKLIFLENVAPNITNNNIGIDNVFNAIHTIRDPSHVWSYNENGWINEIHKGTGGFDKNNIQIIDRLWTKMNWMQFIEWTNPSDNDIRARKSIHVISQYLLNCDCDVGMNFHYTKNEKNEKELMWMSNYIIVKATKN